MQHCVMFAESLDKLQIMVEHYFGGIENKNVPSPEFSHDIYLSEHLQVCNSFYSLRSKKQILIQSLRDTQVLQICFPLHESMIVFYKKKPIDYISTYLEHEGKGSVLSLLKKLGLATNMWL